MTMASRAKTIKSIERERKRLVEREAEEAPAP
jgi:hypothetical protein